MSFLTIRGLQVRLNILEAGAMNASLYSNGEQHPALWIVLCSATGILSQLQCSYLKGSLVAIFCRIAGPGSEIRRYES